MERFTPSTVLRAFLPAQDFALEKQFYLDLGFTLGWNAGDKCVFQVGHIRYFHNIIILLGSLMSSLFHFYG